MRTLATRACAINQYNGLGNQLWDLAGSRPSLDLPFADNKSLVDATTGANLVDFTRASSGTYVDSEGVIRTATTNLLLRSEEFETGWIGAAIITANVATAPNGTTTADRITGSGVSAAQSKTSNTLAAGQGSVVVSVYAKYESHKWLQLFFNGDGTPFANYDIETGIVGSTGTNTTATITPVGDGWYRCVCVKTLGTATDVTGCRIALVDASNSSRNATSATAASLLLWGAQLEQSTTVGEYIPTTSTINSAPRFDHRVTSSVTNLLVRSEEFETTWGATLSTVSADTTTAPNGTATADSLVVNDSLVIINAYISQDVTKPAAVLTYAVSVYAKANQYNRITVTCHDTATLSNRALATVDLSNGTFVTSPSAVGTFSNAAGGTIVDAGNGWYRIGFTFTTSTETGIRTRLSARDSSATTGDGTSGIYIWGAQLEQSSTVGEYVPTTTAAVTVNTTESLGLLVEEQRTNLITSSSDIAGFFTEQNSTVTADAAAAPDGTVTADLLVPNTSPFTHTSFNTSISFSASTTYSYSIFVKPNGYSWLQLLFTSGFGNLTAWVNFDLTGAGSFGFTGGGEISKEIESHPGGWYRCTITATSGASPSAGGPAYLVLDSNRNGRDANYAGDNTSGIYLWGAQLEAGSFPTSYIPTTTATATRAADVASISGSNLTSWFVTTKGTFFAEFAAQAVETRYVMSASTGSSSNLLYIRNKTTGSDSAMSSNGVTGAYRDIAYARSSATNAKHVVGYATNDFDVAAQGVTSTAGPDTSCDTPVTVTRTDIGSLYGQSFIGGTVKRLAYWPTRLPNSTLQAITQ